MRKLIGFELWLVAYREGYEACLRDHNLGASKPRRQTGGVGDRIISAILENPGMTAREVNRAVGLPDNSPIAYRMAGRGSIQRVGDQLYPPDA